MLFIITLKLLIFFIHLNTNLVIRISSHENMFVKTIFILEENHIITCNPLIDKLNIFNIVSLHMGHQEQDEIVLP